MDEVGRQQTVPFPLGEREMERAAERDDSEVGHQRIDDKHEQLDYNEQRYERICPYERLNILSTTKHSITSFLNCIRKRVEKGRSECPVIVGIGIDIVELERIARSIKNDRFVARLLTDAEWALADAYPEQRRIEFIAGRFAAKKRMPKRSGPVLPGACRGDTLKFYRTRWDALA